MASACVTQTNFQQQHHFQLLNGNIMLLQQQHQLPVQYVSKQQQQHHQQQQAIAPALAPKVLGNSNLQNIPPPLSAGALGPMLSKKKYTYNNMPYGEQLPSVARRNARERNRVKQVNNGFSNLRQHLPQAVINSLSNGGRGASKKLSKVDTLRIAVEYIRGLKDMLCDGTAPPSIVDDSAPFILDECSNDGSNYDDFPPMDSPNGSQYQPTTLAQFYHSEASVSPTPSFSDSDISIGGANYLQPLKQEEPQQQQQQQQLPPLQMQFKFEPFEHNNNNNFSNNSSQQLTSNEQPDDEELLDYISLWQQQ